MALSKRFKITDLGTASNYLGTEIEYHDSGIYLHQLSYIKSMLRRLSLQNCNSVKLPMDPKLQLSKDIGTPYVNPHTYRSMVGSLLYATNTRPDICYAVSVISRYMEQPQQAHLQAAKHVLRYLRGTMTHGLFFPRNNSTILHTYVDADWGRDLDTRRSTFGLLHKLGNSSVLWISKLQPTVSLSTTEAEY